MAQNEAQTQTDAAPEPTADEIAAAQAAAAEVSEQKAVRLAKRERLNAASDDLALGAYPVRLPITATIPEVRDRFVGLGVDEASGEQVGLAGRVVFSRNTGKLCFATLQSGDGSRIQAMVSLAEVGEQSLADWKELVDLGDHVFVAGEVITSRRGELSIMVKEWRIASKAILPLPNLHNELSEETRVRSRYLDLIAREQARKNVIDRAKVNASLRRTFDSLGLHRGRDADAAGHARRRIGPPVRDELERVRHRPLPAHRPRALPQARRRRRHRAGVRDQPQLPQRGRRLDAQPRVRDARGLPGLRRLQHDRRPHAAAHPRRGDRRLAARTW